MFRILPELMPYSLKNIVLDPPNYGQSFIPSKWKNYHDNVVRNGMNIAVPSFFNYLRDLSKYVVVSPILDTYVVLSETKK